MNAARLRSYIFYPHISAMVGGSAAFRPSAHRGDDGFEAPAGGGERIVHPGGNLRVNLSANDAVMLQLPKLLGEHPGRHGRQPPAKL